MEKRSVPLVFDRQLCYDCPAQTQCDVGRFVNQFTRNNLEAEVDMSKKFTLNFVNQAYVAIYDGDTKAKERYKKAIAQEIDHEFVRHREFSRQLENLVTVAFNAQELGSEALIDAALDTARQECIDFADNSLSLMPTLDDLRRISRAAQQWRRSGECIQDLIQL